LNIPEIKIIRTFNQLKKVKNLQAKNLKSYLSSTTKFSDGFLTASYSISFLKSITKTSPSIIAEAEGEIVGYLLASTKDLMEGDKFLKNLIMKINRKVYKSKQLSKFDFIIVAQLCVASTHRAQGIVKKMYTLFKNKYSSIYPFCLTVVDLENKRSIRAHLNVGFKIIDSIKMENSEAVIIIWEWH
jgi:hypothetical protein